MKNTVATKLLHVIALSGFALSQPLYSLIASDVTFLVAQKVGVFEIVSLVLVVSFGVPVLLFLAAAFLKGYSNRLSKLGFLSIIGVLGALVVLPMVKFLADINTYLPVVIAVIGGVGFSFIYHRQQLVKTYLTFLSAAAFIFPLWFLLGTQVRSLLFSSEMAAGERANNGTSIVLIVFDELPLSSLMTNSNGIDYNKFPNFAKFSDTSYWFRNASTVSYFTNISVPAILSGNYPKFTTNSEGKSDALIPSHDNYPENLFSLVQGSHQISVSESISSMMQNSQQNRVVDGLSYLERIIIFWIDTSIIYFNVVLPKNLLPMLPGLEGQWVDFANLAGRFADRSTSASRVPQNDGRLIKIFDFINSIDNNSSPQLYYLHTLLPHMPLHYLPSGKYYGPQETFPHGMSDIAWSNDPWEAIQGYQRHMLQLGFVDKLLGEIMKKLKVEQLFDDSVIIITADHGESFKENTHPRKVTPANKQDTLMVPLFVKLPGQTTGAVTDRNVETVDILPTLVEVIESKVNWNFEGLSLFSAEPARQDKKVYHPNGKIDSYDANDTAISASLLRKARLFGEGRLESIFLTGPHNSLLMQEESHLSLSNETPINITIENVNDYNSINTESGFIPAHVKGRILSDNLGYPVELVITLNDKVAAVTKSYVAGNQVGYFSAILPETLFVNGYNELALYVIRKRKGERVFVATRIKPGS